MTPFLLLTVLIIVAECNVIPTQPPPPLPFSPADQILFDVYGNFTAGVAKALADNMIAMQSQLQPSSNSSAESVEDSCAAPGGVDAHSAFGIGHLLAVLNENVWKVSVPVFQELLATAPTTLPDSFEFILKKLLQSPDITFSSVIFTSEDLTLTPSLTKLKVETVKTDLTKPESVEAINNYLTKFLAKPLDESYIPKDATISPAAKAVLIDTLHVSESWASPASKVSAPPKFNGVEAVDMVEILGSFPVMENENAIEIFMPFKNSGRALSLILPKEVSPATQGDFSEPKLQNYSSVRVQLPVFKGTIRNFEANLTFLCNFNKEANFAQLLDHVLVLSLDQDKFETISFTGIQINSVEKFKTVKSVDKAVPVCAAGPTAPLNVSPTSKSSDPSTATTDEKVITFDRSFTWTLLDRDFGPIIAGSVFSPTSQKNTASSPSSPFTFGLENQLAYAKCLRKFDF